MREGGGLTGVCYGWPTPSELSGNRSYATILQTGGDESAAVLTPGAFEPAEPFVFLGAGGQPIACRR